MKERCSGPLALIICLVVIGAGCGERYRVEPLLLEQRDLARGIVQNYDDAARIEAAESLVGKFIKHLRSEECDAAWGLLTPGYQTRFAAVAQQEDAQQLFCEGYKVDGEMLVKGDWVEFLMGTQAFYMTTVPPELGLVTGGDRELFYVVQRDGTYRALLVAGLAGRARLEPF
jgi:hypothetical protein